MYQPSYFREDDLDKLIEAAQKIQLGCFVTAADGKQHATHAPCVIKQTADGTVIEFHVARGNPHWQLEASTQTIAIFQGEQSYVHPGWYPSKAETGKAVPTWVYVTVHFHGLLEVMTEDEELHNHLDELTKLNEAGRHDAWDVADAPEDYMVRMKRGIVGLRLRVASAEGAWKLNQHKTDADHAGVVDGLRASSDTEAAIADLMVAARVKSNA